MTNFMVVCICAGRSAPSARCPVHGDPRITSLADPELVTDAETGGVAPSIGSLSREIDERKWRRMANESIEATDPAITVRLETAASSTKGVVGVKVTVSSKLFDGFLAAQAIQSPAQLADVVAAECLRQFRALEAEVNPKPAEAPQTLEEQLEASINVFQCGADFDHKVTDYDSKGEPVAGMVSICVLRSGHTGPHSAGSSMNANPIRRAKS